MALGYRGMAKDGPLFPRTPGLYRAWVWHVKWRAAVWSQPLVSRSHPCAARRRAPEPRRTRRARRTSPRAATAGAGSVVASGEIGATRPRGRGRCRFLAWRRRRPRPRARGATGTRRQTWSAPKTPSVGTRSNDQRAPRARPSAAAAAAAAAARSDDGACGSERGNRRDEQRPAELEHGAKRGVRQVITPPQRTGPQQPRGVPRGRCAHAAAARSAASVAPRSGRACRGGATVRAAVRAAVAPPSAEIARTSALPDPPDGYPNDLGLSRGAPCGAVV